MYKTLKRIALLLSFVCVIVGCAVFASACNPDSGKETKVTYSVTVTTESDLDLTTLKAQWLTGTEVAGEATLDADGKASVELAADNYTVKLTGLSAEYSCESASVTAENPAATLIVKHIINYTVIVTAEEITLPAGVTAQLYKGDAAVGDPVALAEGRATISAEEGEYTVRLNNLPEYLTYTSATVTASSTSAEITVSYADGEMTVELAVAFPEEFHFGALSAQLYKGEDKVGDPASITEDKATITVAYGVYTLKLEGLPTEEDGSAIFTYDEANVTPENKNIEIFVDYEHPYDAGTSFNPTEFTVGEEYVHTFPMIGAEGPNAWFKTTVPADGDYRIYVGGIADNFNGMAVYDKLSATIGEGFDKIGEEGHKVQHQGNVDIPLPELKGTKFTLKANNTYYFELTFQNGCDVTFTLDVYTSDPGTKDNPYEMTGTGATVNTFDLPMSATVYFKHTLTAESLTEEGVFKFKAVKNSYMLINFYKDAEYTEAIGSEYDPSEQSGFETSELKAGDTVYFTIINKSSTVSQGFTINGVDLSNVLTVGTPLTVSIAPDNNEIKVQAAAGTYTLKYDLDSISTPLEANFGTMKGEYIFGAGSKEVTISENESIKINNYDLNPVEVTFTLTAVGGGLSDVLTVDTPLTVQVAPGDNEIKVQAAAGTYTLKYDLAPVGPPLITTFGNMSEHITSSGSKEVTISENESIKINNVGYGDPVEVTFTLTAAGGAGPSGPTATPELTVGKPAEIEVKHDASSYTINFTIKLVDVPQGNYTLKMEITQPDYVATPFQNMQYTIKLGGNSYTTEKNNTKINSLNVTVPQGCTELIISASSIGYSPTFIFTLTSTSGSQPSQNDLELGVEKSITITNSDGFLDLTIELDAGTYAITLTGDGATKVAVSIDDFSIGNAGEIVGKGESSGTFTITQKKVYTLSFTLTEYGADVNVTVKIEAAAGQADMKLGEAYTITFDSNSTGMEEVTKTIQLEAGWYTVTFSGEKSDIMAIDEQETTIGYRGCDSGELHVEEGGLITITFRYLAKTGCTFTVTITEQ